MKFSRRFFLGSVAAGTTAIAAEKVFDGGFAKVSKPGVPERKNKDGSPAPLVPPGSRGYFNLRSHCVGCQLCVAACPNKVLRPAKGLAGPTPVMGFENGWCRPECTRCGEVCPAGAIKPITVERKRDIHVGHAIWHKDACIAAQHGVTCTTCVRHCPARAIVQVPLDPKNPSSPLVPVVDTLKCIGCGACEHFCPARPMPGLTVKGFEKHREVVPMSENEAIAEAIALVELGKVGCVLVKDGVIQATAKGMGVRPIVQLFDTRAESFKGAVVVDKVIGRAAAAVAVSAGAAKVVALTMSEDAAAFLDANGMPHEAKTMVPEILNKDKTSSCPMEARVKDLTDPAAMVDALRK